MCVICRQNPCNNKCPNYDDKVIGICTYCGETITYNQEPYTDVDNSLFCTSDCAMSYYFDVNQLTKYEEGSRCQI